MRHLRQAPHAWTPLLAALCFCACRDTTGPGSTAFVDGGARFDGSLDPAAASFVFERLAQPVPGQESIPLDLVGSNLEVGPEAGTVSLASVSAAAALRSS